MPALSLIDRVRLSTGTTRNYTTHYYARVALSRSQRLAQSFLDRFTKASLGVTWVFHFRGNAVEIRRAKQGSACPASVPIFVGYYWGYVSAQSADSARQVVLDALADRARRLPIKIHNRIVGL